ncbi:MAG: WG repeat-containing protein [Alphaproteobacteria bacterium]
MGLLGFVGCSSDFFYAYRDKHTDLYGIKNQAGHVIVPPQYEMIFAAQDEKLFHPSNPNYLYLVPVQKKGSFFLISKDGVPIFRSVYHDNGHDYYIEGLARFIEKGKDGKDRVGFHDREGKIVIPARYDFAGPFNNGYEFVNNGCWMQETKLKKYPPVSGHPFPPPFAEPSWEYSKVLKGGLWGAINLKGQEVIPIVYKNDQEVSTLLEKKFGWV